jgi:hypothetical protein
MPWSQYVPAEFVEEELIAIKRLPRPEAIPFQAGTKAF